MEAKVQIKVRYSETDQMGVVYHGNYFPWFDEARFAIMKKLGIDPKELEAQGIFMPIVDVQCKYKTPAVFDDLITVEAKADPAYPNQLVVNFKVIRERDGRVLSEARTRSVIVNREGMIIPKKIFKDSGVKEVDID